MFFDLAFYRVRGDQRLEAARPDRRESRVAASRSKGLVTNSRSAEAALE